MRYTFLSRDSEGVPMARGGPPKQMKVCVARWGGLQPAARIHPRLLVPDPGLAA